MKRHSDRKHADESSDVRIQETRNEGTANESAVSLPTILASAGLEELTEKFNEEKVDLEMLLELQDDDFDRLMVDFNIKWGPRYKLKRALKDSKFSKAQDVPVLVQETASVEKASENDSCEEGPESIDINYNSSIPEVTEGLDEESVNTGAEYSLAADTCAVCEAASQQENPQHRCMRCGTVVCSIFCSIQDPTSDNEMHRVHRVGDIRCSFTENQNPISFHCPKCPSIFADNVTLQSHIAKSHEAFETSFETMSLVSDGTLSDIYETCKQCGKTFQNELDVADHELRVHKYGETFDLYPCEECGFRGTDLLDIRNHIEISHKVQDTSSLISINQTEDISLEDLGIEKLPEISGRIKQNLKDLVDENGEFHVEDGSDDEFNIQEEHSFLSTDDWTPTPPRNRVQTRNRPKVTEIIEKVPPVQEKKRKSNEDLVVSTKRRKRDPANNSFQCEHCSIFFTRKDNLGRHMRNKH